MATNVASLYADIGLRDNLTGGLQRAEGQLDSFAGRATTFGNSMMGLGGRITAGLTAPIVAGFGFATKAAIDYESAFAGVVKTVDASETELAALNAGLRDMATNAERPVSSLTNAHVELARIAEVAGQLGVGVDDIEEFTETIGMLGMTTDLTGEQAAMSLAQFMNITGLPTSDIRLLGDVIVDLGNNMATTESTIVEFGQRLAGVGASVGMSDDEILALSATLASLGLEPEAGASAASAAISKMVDVSAKGGEELNVLAGAAQVTTDEFKTMLANDPTAALMAFSQGLGEMNAEEQIGVLDTLGLSGIRTTDMFRRLSANTDIYARSLDIASEAMTGNGALMEEARKRAETTASNIALFKNNVNDLGVSIGNALLPRLNEFLGIISPIIAGLADANPEVINMAIAGAALVAGIGPAVATVGALATAIGFIVSPVGLAVAAAAALGVAYLTNFGGVRDFVDGTVRPALMDFFGWMANTWTEVQPALTAIWDWFTQTGLPAATDFVTGTAIPGIMKFINIIAGIWGLVSAGLTLLHDWFVTDGLPAILDFLSGPAKEGVDNFINLNIGIWKLAQTGWNALKDGVKFILDALGIDIDNLKKRLEDLWTFFQDTKGRVGAGLGALEGIGGGLLSGQITPQMLAGAIGAEFRASGGPVSGGSPYVVGEAGAELFVPRESGTIIPNDQLGGQTYNINIIVTEGNARAAGTEFAAGFEERRRSMA